MWTEVGGYGCGEMDEFSGRVGSSSGGWVCEVVWEGVRWFGREV